MGRWMSIKEASEHFNLHHNTIRRMIQKGLIKAFKTSPNSRSGKWLIWVETAGAPTPAPESSEKSSEKSHERR